MLEERSYLTAKENEILSTEIYFLFLRIEQKWSKTDSLQLLTVLIKKYKQKKTKTQTKQKPTNTHAKKCSI